MPYKGLGQAVAAVVTGEATLTWAGVYSAEVHVRAGRLRALTVGAPERSPFLPDVPTFAELGYPAIRYTLWYGLFAPAATPHTLVDRMHGDVAALLADPDVVQRELRAHGYEPSALTPAQFGDALRREHAARASLVERSGARPE